MTPPAKLVPREPTDEMLEAARDFQATFATEWKAMYDAAPVIAPAATTAPAHPLYTELVEALERWVKMADDLRVLLPTGAMNLSSHSRALLARAREVNCG